jgi:hypothetical protein
MQALAELTSLGYRAELAPTGKIKLTWTRPDMEPDPAVVSPLLEDLKAHRDQAIDHLRRTVAVDLSTPTGRKTISIHGSDGRPTEAAVDLADRILSFLANEAEPATEAEIFAAMGGDSLFTRNVLHRLAVEGLAELAGPNRYTIPDYPPKAADLPVGCPLLGGPFPETCRFHPKLFRTLLEQGVIPLPGGRCPLRNICKL